MSPLVLPSKERQKAGGRQEEKEENVKITVEGLKTVQIKNRKINQNGGYEHKRNCNEFLD